MDKQFILEEIKRTARENGGRPLGREVFQKQTGIKPYDWFGKYWIRWGDALKEAGFEPNALKIAIPKELLLEKLCRLTRELGHFPTRGELQLKINSDETSPSFSVFMRLGNKRTAVLKLIDYARQHNYDDVIKLCQVPQPSSTTKEAPKKSNQIIGSVYLIKFGKYYKIGRTNALGRRKYEIELQLPEKARLIHEIKTDDPIGIEAYWHNRFDKYRTNGEWFVLTQTEVNAFKLRRFM